MPEIKHQPSFNHQVVKSLTKEQFLEQHPDHGAEWDKINGVEVKEEKAEKKKGNK